MDMGNHNYMQDSFVVDDEAEIPENKDHIFVYLVYYKPIYFFYFFYNFSIKSILFIY